MADLRYRFSGFELNAATRQLSCDGNTQPLSPILFELLLLLVSSQGRVISKDELFEKIWKGTSVGENSIARAIASLRRCLGENLDTTPGREEFIVTVPRVGYRFVPAVDVVQGHPTRPNVGRSDALVGRHQEMDALRAAIVEAERGHGSFICVTGEAGIGKTTLVETVMDGLDTDTYLAATGSC